jgi:hypothetical protein
MTLSVSASVVHVLTVSVWADVSLSLWMTLGVSHVLIVSAERDLLSRAALLAQRVLCFRGELTTDGGGAQGGRSRVGRPRARECSTLRVAGRESNRAPRDEAAGTRTTSCRHRRAPTGKRRLAR